MKSLCTYKINNDKENNNFISDAFNKCIDSKFTEYEQPEYKHIARPG